MYEYDCNIACMRTHFFTCMSIYHQILMLDAYHRLKEASMPVMSDWIEGDSGEESDDHRYIVHLLSTFLRNSSHSMHVNFHRRAVTGSSASQRRTLQLSKVTLHSLSLRLVSAN